MRVPRAVRLAITLSALTLLVVAGAWLLTRGGGNTTGDSPAGEARATKSPSPPPRPKGEPFSLSWVGDMMIGSLTPSPQLPPNDAAGMFSAVESLLVADLVTGNLEGPLADKGPVKCVNRPDCYTFSQPPRYASVYRDAGFQLLNLANNHSNDRGEPGRTSTLQALDGVDIKYAGFPGQVAHLEVKGNRIAALGFSHYTATNPRGDLNAVAAQIREAAAASDVVVVFFHGGLEGAKGQRISHTGDPGGDLIGLAHTAVDAGADLVLGSGSHVLRAMEVYKGRLIAYSLGNFATYAMFSLKGPTAQGGVLVATVAPDGAFVTGRLHATHQVGEGVPKPGGDAASLVGNLSKVDFPQTGVKVAPDGSISAPAAPGASPSG